MPRRNSSLLYIGMTTRSPSSLVRFSGLVFSTSYVFGSTSMIGQGRHSEDGVPKLRPALEELFNEYV